MKKYIYITTILLVVMAGKSSFAQSKIKDGSIPATSSLPNTNAILELESNSKGFLLPRVALSSLTAFAPLSAHVAGISVYNTATAGDVTPGYYYNDGTKWVRIAEATAADLSKDAWVDDNANAQVKMGALSDGTTARADSAAFVAKDNGYVGIGLISPAGLLDIKGKMYVNNQQTIYNAGALNSNFSGSLFLGNGGQNLLHSAGSQAYYNTGLGIGALNATTTGADNTAIGNSSLSGNTTGISNTAVGSKALFSNTSGSNNTAFGDSALYTNTSGNFNNAIGNYSLYRLSSGRDNTGIGYNALFNTSSGISNVAVGTAALLANTTGNFNVSVGINSLLNAKAEGNTALGYRAAMGITTGTYNTIVGAIPGTGTTIGVTTGSKNTILGANVTGLPAALSNNIILADGDGNQRIRVLNNGHTGIGTTNPLNQLHIVSAGDPLRLDGVQTGSVTDSILSISTGVVKRVSRNSIAGLLTGSAIAQGTTITDIASGAGPTDITGCTFTITPEVDSRIMITSSALPLPGGASTSTQGTIDLVENGTRIASQYFSSSDGTSLDGLGTFTTITRTVDLTAGVLYTFKLQAKSWVGAVRFNNNPVSGGGGDSYAGASAGDENTQKSQISYQLFTR